MSKRKLLATGIACMVGLGTLTACASQSSPQPVNTIPPSSTASPNREAGVANQKIQLTLVNNRPNRFGYMIVDSLGEGGSERHVPTGESLTTYRTGHEIQISVPGQRWDTFKVVNSITGKPYFQYTSNADGKDADIIELNVGESKEWTSPKTGTTYTMSRQENIDNLKHMKLVLSQQ